MELPQDLNPRPERWRPFAFPTASPSNGEAGSRRVVGSFLGEPALPDPGFPRQQDGATIVCCHPLEEISQRALFGPSSDEIR